MLGNQNGGYFYLGLANHPSSRYQGLFLRESGRMYKVVESVYVDGLEGSDAADFTYRLSSIQRRHRRIKETFWLPEGRNVLVYSLNKPCLIHLDLDIRESYDSRKFGKNYKIVESRRDKIVIEYTKEKDRQEDGSEGIEYKAFVVLKGEFKDIRPVGHFKLSHYFLDWLRKSPPYYNFIYQALQVKTKRLVVAFSLDRERAEREAENW
jgi:hypothetical protein